MTPEEYLAEKSVNLPLSYGGCTTLVHMEDAIEALKMDRRDIKCKVEQEKQKLWKQVWHDSDKPIIGMMAHKLDKIIRFIEDKR